MEVNEGQTRITTVPYILIGDVPLDKCTLPQIAKEMQAHCKKIHEQRQTIKILRDQLQEKTIATD